MEYTIHNLFGVTIEDNRKCVVFGYGKAGQAIAWYLTHKKHIKMLCFCDNNREKHNSEVYPPIYSLEETRKLGLSCYIIGFMKNDEKKIQSSLSALKKLGISQNDIIIVDMSLENYRRIEEMYVENYIKLLKQNQRTKEDVEYVKKIVFLSDGFNENTEQTGGGGPIGAICMQKRYLGNECQEVSLEYPYYAEQQTFQKLGNRFSNYEAVKEIAEKMGEGTIYITNDIFSAFSLGILGKRYCLIYHGQGDVVQESFCRGDGLSDKENKIIYDIERYALKEAHKVFFPSKGASQYFEKCFEEKIEYNKGKPLYNAIYDFPEEKKLPGIERINDTITFLSVGQMTWLKGTDQIPEFIEKYVEKTKLKVRWIVVAGGIMKNDVDVKMGKLIEKYPSLVTYVNIDYRITHSEIFYLMGICDVYIMLHRVSIFDFSTLEAMYYGKPIILSDIPGNDEYNMEENVLLVDVHNLDIELTREYIEKKKYYGKLNQRVYNKYFSKKPFVERYECMLNDFMTQIV